MQITEIWLEEMKGMKEPNPTSLQLEQGVPRGGKAGSRVQYEYITEGPTWKASEEGKDLPGQRMEQRWEAQWQEFLKTLQSPSWAWGSLPPAEETPWDEAKAFLASFEQVAKACRWPKEEWVARLLPALSGEAEQAFRSLEAGDREDYGKVKAAILRAEALRVGLQRQHFRLFCCQEVEDPRRVYSQVQELGSRWLKPERRSKEQILELLVLEQFLASLPQDLQGWIRGGGPESCSQAVGLAEDFLLKRQQEADSARWQGPSQDVCVGSPEAERKSPDAAQRQICEEAKPVQDAVIPLLGDGIKGPSPSISVFPPEGQVKTEARLGAGLLDCRDTGVPLHRAEQTLSQPGQQTIFWQVLQEEGGNAQPFGEVEATLLKVETSQHGVNELKERPGAVPLLNQRDGPLMVETCGQRSNEKRGWKKKKIPPQSLQRTQNVPTGRKLHKCSTCEKDFKSRADLTCHQLSHTGQKPYQCSECKKCFSLKGTLIRHQRSHTGVKPYKCSQCGKCFTRRSSLKNHQRIHTGEKPYKCSQCGKCFSQRYTLKDHQRIHTGEKPYKCSQYAKFFTLRSSLKDHKGIHTGVKPYECSQCEKCF
ncbi:zinc finger and SCAN domain-containing protein 31 [Anolis carolinensis]|uniref:zinc finger and SCAN domain-containing protein 31 n=1 Tax=Anolis carolinensis TaxID=28377 RepID=UPI002F2B447B